MPSWLWEVIGRVADIVGIIGFIISVVGGATGGLLARPRRGAGTVLPAYFIVLGIFGACASLASGLVRLWLRQEDLPAVVLMTAGAAGALAGCTYICFWRAKTGQKIFNSHGIPLCEVTKPAYPERQRIVARIGLVLVTLVTVSGLAGWLYVRGLPPQEAISHFDWAIALKPYDANVYNNRGTAYYEQGQYERAIADFARAIELAPNDADFHYNLGAAYFRKGKMTDAITEFQEALRLKPTMAEAHYGLGVAYKQIGDKEKAIAELKEALRLTTDARLKAETEEYLRELIGN